MALLFLAFSQAVVAGWTLDRSASFDPDTCSLIRLYNDGGTPSEVIFSNLGYSSGIGMLAVAFSVATSDSDFAKEPVAAGDFILSVTTKIHEVYAGRTLEFSGISVDGTILSEVAVSDDGRQTVYFIRTSRARSIFESFEAGIAIPIEFRLANGETGTLAFPADPDRKFVIWSAMLEACKVANVT